MIDPKRREMFTDLYRIAEYYELLPFRPGNIEWNANWFVVANEEQLQPFLTKYTDQMALDLAMAIVDEASRKAAELNKM